MNILSEIDGDLDKKDKITELLDKRNKQRQNNLNTKHEFNRKNAAENEDQEIFHTTFREHARRIGKDLNALQPSDPNSLTVEFNKLLTNIQNLQNYLTSSTLFLSNYNVKACQETLNSLKGKLEETREKFLGKKKFGFRSKANVTSAAKQNAFKSDESKSTSAAEKTSQFVNWTVQNKSHEEIYLANEEVNHKDITISTLSHCVLRIEGHPASLQLSNLTDCIVLCGPVGRSVFGDHCTDCKLIFGCQQLRFHSSTACDLYMHVTCRAIIEDCKEINVAPYNYVYSDLYRDFEAAGLDLSKNNWAYVADFNWLSTDVHSPNWRKISADAIIGDWNAFVQEFKNKTNVS